MANSNKVIIKTLSELKNLVIEIGAIEILNKDFDMVAEYDTNFKIDISLADNILNEVIEIEKLQPKFIKEKIKQLQYLSAKVLDYSNIFEKIANGNEIKYSDFVIKSLELLSVFAMIRDNLKLLTTNENNSYSRIFKTATHFKLFEHLLKQVTKNELAEFSFIYWAMFQDKFIDEGVKPKEFINWLSKTYEIELTELKQFNRVNTGNKPANYQTAKLLFQC